MDWWKSKHNTHHAAPNELDENFQVPTVPAVHSASTTYIGMTRLSSNGHICDTGHVLQCVTNSLQSVGWWHAC